MERDFLNMLSQMALAHEAINRFGFDGEGPSQSATPAQQRASALTNEVRSAASLRQAAAKKTFESSLAQFKKDKSFSSASERKSIKLLERFSEARDEVETNSGLYGRAPSNLSPEEIKTFQRKPSYLLLSPILEDVHYGYQGEESLEKGNISLRKRKLLTAQTAAIKLESETLRDKILLEATSGERYMPLPVDAANLERFAVMSSAAIQRVAKFVDLPANERRESIMYAFRRIATNYFDYVNKVPPGVEEELFTPDLGVEIAGQMVGHEPITVILTDTDKFPVGHIIALEGAGMLYMRIALEISVKNLLSPLQHGLPTDSPLGQTDAFSSASGSKKQAAALLHNLFFALADAEEKMHYHECKAANGANVPASAALAMLDKCYKGSRTIGDQVNADQQLSQRAAYTERFELSMKSKAKKPDSLESRLLAPMRSNNGMGKSGAEGMPLLLDDSLNEWAASSEARHLIHGLNNPTDRLRIAQMPMVDAALLRVLQS